MHYLIRSVNGPVLLDFYIFLGLDQYVRSIKILDQTRFKKKKILDQT